MHIIYAALDISLAVRRGRNQRKSRARAFSQKFRYVGDVGVPDSHVIAHALVGIGQSEFEFPRNNLPYEISSVSEISARALRRGKTVFVANYRNVAFIEYFRQIIGNLRQIPLTI